MDYMCVDLKSFYASVECVLRGLDPFTTPLVVANKKRGEGSIILAVTPYLKKFGIKSRCRIFDLPIELKDKIIYAIPRMKLYIDYSILVYKALLHFFSQEDIHVYSIDESFIYIKPYIKYYGLKEEELAKMILDYIYEETKLTATCGIGENLFLCKVALDIYAKKINSNISILSKKDFFDKLWEHKPITDFWSIGNGIAKRLEKYGVFTLKDIALKPMEVFYKEFGIIGKELYEHAWGIDSTLIKDIKEPRKRKGISSSQILFEDYDILDAETILIEMIDEIVLELISHNKKATSISLTVGYSKEIGGGFRVSKKIDIPTDSYHLILKEFIKLFNDNILDLKVRTIGVVLSGLIDSNYGQISFFDVDNTREKKLYETINNLKSKFGKNSVVKAISKLDKANQINRNKLIGGHNEK